MDDEAEIGLYRTAGKNLHVACNRIFLAELLQQARKRALSDGRLIAIPNAPLSLCRTTRMTVR